MSEKATTVSERQLRDALRNQVKHSNIQNIAMETINRTLGATGSTITKIKKLVIEDNSDLAKEILALLLKLEAHATRVHKGGKDRGKPLANK